MIIDCKIKNYRGAAVTIGVLMDTNRSTGESTSTPLN